METPPPIVQKRPVFLTVLCILTFIASGWATLSGLIGVFTMGAATEAMELAAEMYYEMADDMDGGLAEMMIMAADYMMLLAPNAAIMQLFTFLLSALSLTGGILMWHQRKVGFHIYTAANVFLLVVPLALIGFHAFVLLTVAISAVFTILFIVLYGMNLKHLR